MDTGRDRIDTRKKSPNKSDLLASIRRELRENADPATQATGEHFFKEAVIMYGVKTPVVVKMAARYFAEIKRLPKAEIFRLCEDLLRSDYTEEAVIACDWAYRLRDQYEPADFAVFEGWVSKYVDNWAKCDTLCNHTIGAFVDHYPEYVENLKRWAGSPNRWLRRAAAVTMILPARQGKFLKAIFQLYHME